MFDRDFQTILVCVIFMFNRRLFRHDWHSVAFGRLSEDCIEYSCIKEAFCAGKRKGPPRWRSSCRETQSTSLDDFDYAAAARIDNDASTIDMVLPDLSPAAADACNISWASLS
jgi:hypothetical protein